MANSASHLKRHWYSGIGISIEHTGSARLDVLPRGMKSRASLLPSQIQEGRSTCFGGRVIVAAIKSSFKTKYSSLSNCGIRSILSALTILFLTVLAFLRACLFLSGRYLSRILSSSSVPEVVNRDSGLHGQNECKRPVNTILDARGILEPGWMIKPPGVNHEAERGQGGTWARSGFGEGW